MEGSHRWSRPPTEHGGPTEVRTARSTAGETRPEDGTNGHRPEEPPPRHEAEAADTHTEPETLPVRVRPKRSKRKRVKLTLMVVGIKLLMAVFAVCRFLKRCATGIIRWVSQPRWMRVGEYYYLLPEGGLRKWLYEASEHRWKFKGFVSQRQKSASSVITARRLAQCAVIAVISFAGGVSKTTDAVLTALKLRRKWPGVPILVVDMNSGPGTLRKRLNVSRENIQAYVDGKEEGNEAKQAQACWTFEDVWRNRTILENAPEKVPNLNYHFAYNIELGVYVLSGQVPTDRDESRFAGVDYDAVMELLKGCFVFIVLDCGTDPWNEISQQIMKSANVIEVATTTSEDRLEQVADFLATMEQPRYHHQRDKLVVAINRVLVNFFNRTTDRAMSKVQKYLKEEYGLPPFAGPVVTLPWSIHLIRGRSVNADKLWGRMDAYALEIAAAAMQVVYDNLEPEEATDDSTQSAGDGDVTVEPAGNGDVTVEPAGNGGATIGEHPPAE